MPEFYRKQQVTARIDAVNHASRRLTPESINKGWRMASGAWLGLETCHSSQMKTAPQQGFIHQILFETTSLLTPLFQIFV